MEWVKFMILSVFERIYQLTLIDFGVTLEHAMAGIASPCGLIVGIGPVVV